MIGAGLGVRVITSWRWESRPGCRVVVLGFGAAGMVLVGTLCVACGGVMTVQRLQRNVQLLDVGCAGSTF